MPNPNWTLTDAEIAQKNAIANASNLWRTSQGNTPNVGVKMPGVILPTNNRFGDTSFTQLTDAQRNAQLYNTNQRLAKGSINQPAVGSVASVLGDWFGDSAFDIEANRQAEEARLASNQSIDPNAIYNEQLALRQAQIDATNSLYRDQLNQARIQGQWRLGSGGAIQARRWLLGSSFGEAQTNKIQDVNTGIENSIEQERLAVVNQIMTNARESAAADIAEKRRAKEAGGKAYLEYLSGANDRKSAKTSKAAQLLLSLGKSPQDISDAELKQAGISRQDLTMEYTAGKSVQEQAKASAQAEQEKAALEALKTQSEIDKNQAAIITEALKTGRVYESGWFIFDGATNEVIGNAQAVQKARASGGGGGGWYIGGSATGVGGWFDISSLSPQAQAVINQINTAWGKPQDYILWTSAASQRLLNEVLQWLNAQWGTGTLASETRKQSLDLATATIDDLLKNKNLAGSFQTRRVGDTGLWSVFNLTANENVNFVNRVDALAGQLMQIDWPTLKAIFWPQISNSDIEMIKKTILQGLDPRNQNPAAFEKTLNDVKNKMVAYTKRIPANQWVIPVTPQAPTEWEVNVNNPFWV